LVFRSHICHQDLKEKGFARTYGYRFHGPVHLDGILHHKGNFRAAGAPGTREANSASPVWKIPRAAPGGDPLARVLPISNFAWLLFWS
jgi:hypothetical protein